MDLRSIFDLSVGIICVVCFLAHVQSKNPFFCLSFLGKFMKSVVMKLNYLKIVCGKTKHAYLFPLWRPPLALGLNQVCGDHLCALFYRACSVFGSNKKTISSVIMKII